MNYNLSKSQNQKGGQNLEISISVRSIFVGRGLFGSKTDKGLIKILLSTEDCKRSISTCHVGNLHYLKEP